MNAKIAAAVRNLMKISSYLDEERPAGGGDDNELYYATRENGDVGEERPGRADIVHARDMKAAILANVPGVTATIDTCDEWVSLIVRAA